MAFYLQFTAANICVQSGDRVPCGRRQRFQLLASRRLFRLSEEEPLSSDTTRDRRRLSQVRETGGRWRCADTSVPSQLPRHQGT